MDRAEIVSLVLRNLAGKELAVACCCCRLWREIGRSDHLWKSLCRDRWPGCETPEALKVIHAMGGFRNFFSRRASAMFKLPKRFPPRPWLRLEHLTFFVDLSYKGVPTISEVIPGGRLAGNSFSVSLQIDPSVTTDSLHPSEALTPSLYHGQMYYAKPFQRLHASDYWLNWSVVRSTDHKVACLLHTAPVPDGIVPWEDDGDGGDDFCLPLLFQGEIFETMVAAGALYRQTPLLTYACLDCRPIWGESLSERMRFELVELQLGVWRSDEKCAPPIDKVLLTLQDLEWK